MLRFLLIRHGNTDPLGSVLYGRMAGVELNAEGYKQARILGQILKERYSLTAVVSSPLERALQTATAIASAQDLEVMTEEGLNEVDCGLWTGKSFSELDCLEDWRKFNHSRALSSPPGGELMMHVQARAWTTLKRIAERYDSQQNPTFAVITHGDVIRALLILILGMPLDHIYRLVVAPASVSEVVWDGPDPVVLAINLVF